MDRPTWATSLAENEGVLARIRDRVLDGAALRPGQTALDLGAGTGLLTFEAVRRVAPTGRVVALDRDPGCLDAISRRAAGLGLLGQAVLVVAGAADALPLATASVDAVVVRSVLVYVEARDAAASEIVRVLKPGGALSVYEPLPGCLREEGSPDWRPVWAVRLAIERLIANQREQPRRRAAASLTSDALVEVLQAAGMTDVRVESAGSVKAPPADPVAHFDLLRLPGDPSPDDPRWHDQLRRQCSEADLRAYVEHALTQARRGRYSVFLPSFFLTARKPQA